MRTILLLAALGATAPAVAQDWNLRAGDERFTKSALAEFLARNEVRFYDGGRSEYGPGDAYAYVYEGGGRAEGRYRIEEGGAVCVAFRNGRSRCDFYVRNGGRVLLIDEEGARFPLKPPG